MWSCSVSAYADSEPDGADKAMQIDKGTDIHQCSKVLPATGLECCLASTCPGVPFSPVCDSRAYKPPEALAPLPPPTTDRQIQTESVWAPKPLDAHANPHAPVMLAPTPKGEFTSQEKLEGALDEQTGGAHQTQVWPDQHLCW